MTVDLDVIDSLDDLVRFIDGRRTDVYVRWSRDPEEDQENGCSLDELTGVSLPGLSVNSFAVETWWEDRPMRLWLARRLYDYRHLRERRGPDVRPWVLEGGIVGRGPDNEPLVRCDKPLAWLADGVIDEATRLIEEQPSDWGTLDRSS